MTYLSNILDPIQPTLSNLIWDKPEAERPELKPRVAHWITQHIYTVLEQGGYSKPHEWLRLVLTGSLTTFQYSDSSDCDVSLFVDSAQFPEWSRSEMIGLMISGTDGVVIPGTPYELQAFIVAKEIKPHDLYKKGLRAGYDIIAGRWIEPPDHDRDHNVEQQENGFYVYAMQMADKLESLLKYEPEKAVELWHQIHVRRQRDQTAGKGDFAESNIVYKFLSQRGLMPQIAQQSGEYIAKFAFIPEPAPFSPGQEQHGHPCPWCGQEHPPGFDTNQCPARLEKLRAMWQPTNPGFEPAPFTASWRVISLDLGTPAYQSILNTGGVTMNLQGQMLAVGQSQGFAVGIKGSGETFPQQQFTPQDVNQFIASRQAMLSQPNRYFGGWIQDGQVYLDVSTILQDRNEAHQLAYSTGELAIFDLATGEEIDTTQPPQSSTSPAPAQGQPQDPQPME